MFPEPSDPLAAAAKPAPQQPCAAPHAPDAPAAAAMPGSEAFAVPGGVESSWRRNLLWTGVGLAAAGAGVWLATRTEAPLPLVAAPQEPVPGFWAMQWSSPQGSPVLMRSFQGKPLLLNFWATWCPPCVEELPLFQRFYNEHAAKGFQVLALAVDRTDAVQTFLKKMPLDFPVGLAGMAGADLGRALGNLSGGLPFSVLLASDGSVAQRKMGRVMPEELAAWATVR